MKKKSQQGIALIWLILTGVLLITGVGMVLSRKQAKVIKEDQQVSQPEEIKKGVGEEGEVFVGKINELTNKNVPLKCTYTQEGFSGLSFVKGKKMYSEISVEGGVSTYVIVKDNCMWSWYQGEDQGTKMCFEEDIWNMTEAIPVETEYHCVTVSFSESQFDPPGKVSFTNIGEKPSRGEEDLLKILPPKERAELESAIRETQQVLKNIEVFNFAPPSIDQITQGLGQVNKQAQEQIQKDLEKQRQEFTPPEIDYEKLKEYLKQNPQYGPDYKSPQEQKLEEIEEILEVDLDKPH